MEQVRRLLETFNQQQGSGEKLETENWCKQILEALKLRNDSDILTADFVSALSLLINGAANEDEIKVIKQFFSHLQKYRCSVITAKVNKGFEDLAGAQQKVELHKLISDLTENVKCLRKSASSQEFDQAIMQCQGLDKFKEACIQICQNDMETGKLMTKLLETSSCLSPISERLSTILHLTKLMPYLFSRITVLKLTEITRRDTPQSVEDPAWQLLRRLTACNHKARNEAGSSQADSSQSAGKVLSLRERMQRQSALMLHPMDILHASFLCCDAEAKQFLCQRLFACKLAFPFLYVNEDNQLVQSDWTLRDICLEYKNQGGDLVETCLCADVTLPVVSFLRLGELRVSKSKVLNHLLYPEYHDTFFNRCSENGRLKRSCINGLVETAVCLPSKNSKNLAFLALNLRGDIDCHPEQADRLVQASQCCVLFLCGDELKVSSVLQKIQQIRNRVSSMIIVISAHESCRVDTTELLTFVENNIEPFGIQVVMAYLNSECLPDSEVSKEIESLLCTVLSTEPVPRPIGNRDKLNRSSDVSDEAMNFAIAISNELCLDEYDTSVAFPVQGESWCDISKFERMLYQVKNDKARITQQIISYREAQISCFADDKCTKLFLEHLKCLKVISRRKIYLQSVRLLLEDHTRKSAPALRKEYLRLKQQAEYHQKDRTAAASSATQSSELQGTQAQLKLAEKRLQESSFHINVIFREIALLYDAHAHVNPMSMPDDIRQLPHLFASLLLSGVPLELLDGNVGNIPMKWVSAVLDQCKQLVGDKKLFVVSVLGTQSTGKSTLLNTMFGLRLPVSAGRCTRGAFLQLVQVDENSQLPFQYLAVIDTEGLRAIELGTNQYHHDNELATLVISIADLTMITVAGEDSAEMRDVLEIVIHAFVKMKRVEESIKRKCIFVHQNVSDATAMQKLRGEISKRQSVLDDITRAAAEKEDVSGVKCFSDIISFSPERDTFFMSCLWHGDPPMAPVNPGYSANVQAIMRHVIQYSTTSERILKFSDFESRISDTWKAVLSEDFVFSFRNSIEMKAYRLLEEEFTQLLSESRDIAKAYLAKTCAPKVKKLVTHSDLNRMKKKTSR